VTVPPGLLDAARDLGAEVVAMRHELHRRPELGLHTPQTRDAVLAALEGLPLDLTLHETTSGVAALLIGARPGPTVLLRGDMDALPLHEDTGEACTSRVDGLMHACGHDGHTAMLAGAARLLSGCRDEIAGRVLFMFQPGEENGAAGARHMLDEGLLDLPPHPVDGSASPVTAAYALHLTPNAPTGMVVTRRGPLMASSDRLTVTVSGRGGHASQPHHALDPVPVACEIVQALQTMVTRRIDVFDPGIVTVGRIVAGTTTNVIPETATIEGTMRAVSAATRQRLHDGVRRVAEGIAAAHGATAEVVLGEGYPVTVNDGPSADTALDVATGLLGAGSVFRLPNPTMGAEDFSYVVERVPGAMVFLGCTPHDRDFTTAASNHSNRVVHDDAALPTGVALHAAFALHHLATR
jgi:hippurate hydrolase